jgi:hypothetical protein
VKAVPVFARGEREGKSSVREAATASSKLRLETRSRYASTRVAHSRQNSPLGEHHVAVEAGRLGELKPLLDAARPGAISVVIDNALAPRAAEGGIVAPRENDRVFDGKRKARKKSSRGHRCELLQ